MTYYTKQGLSFDDVFITGDGKQITNYLDESGLDVGSKYISGDTLFDVGYQIADGTDIGRMFGGVIAGIYRTPGTWWYKTHSQHSPWYDEGLEWLKKYESNKKVMVCVNDKNETVGGDCSSSLTSWHAFMLVAPTSVNDVTMSVNFRTTDGGNGTVEWSGLKTFAKNQTGFVIVGDGGDGGHYGEGIVQIKLTVPSIGSWSYYGKFWTYTD